MLRVGRKTLALNPQLIIAYGKIRQPETPLVVAGDFPGLVVIDIGNIDGGANDASAADILHPAGERRRGDGLLGECGA